ncbi:TetR/AcrR family transcriptional regulator [Paenibacillus dokdonensis]|uniref:TetR/AcrR family transcriptional regulator n=1 Tax=Paenibacillus dokdonensis TaxID=2567944 RepID=A0ABU6GNM8_9BACL|nr:TetR/AcrR family transcriptional regulator [Paenibacillus dokdonensis]MEC0241033.1 TetR/AcrR family transcriptional regulator [Paenibacillus dokdonensis]
MNDSGQTSNSSLQQILNAAEQLIKEKGCRQTTLQDIITTSGLSKGAIYHYVSGKDDLFGMILKSKMESMNARFRQAVTQAADRDARMPVQAITEGMMSGADKEQVSNKIFTYLLSQVDNPKVAHVLREVYDYSLQTATAWITTGQQAGAIPPHIDAGHMASMYMVFTYGLRVRSTIVQDSEGAIPMEDIFGLLIHSLK